MDVDLRKIPLITYKTTQAGIGGNFEKFLPFPFIPYTTRKPKAAKQRACPVSLFVGQYCDFLKMPKMSAKKQEIFF